MNFAELQNATLGTSFAPEVYRQAAKGFLNDALDELVRMVNMPAIEAVAQVTTVPGETDYDLPEDYLRLRGRTPITIGEDVLDEADPAWIVIQDPITAKPRFFAFTEGLIRLYPIPLGGEVVTMRYDASVPHMVADIDVPAIPEHMHKALTYFAKSSLFAEEDDADMANYWLMRWQAALHRFRNERHGSIAPRQVPGTWGYPEGPHTGWPKVRLP